MKKRHKTTKLKNNIRTNFGTITSFAKLVEKEVGVPYKTVLSHIFGYFTPTNPSEIKAYAKLLDVDLEWVAGIFGIEMSDVTEESIEDDDSQSPEMSEFLEINTQNIHDIFGIINQNIIRLAKKMDIIARSDEELERLERLERSLESLAEKISNAPTVNPDKPSARVIINKNNSDSINKTEVEKLTKGGYSQGDSYESYKNKINRMVHFIAIATHDTHRQILHKLYKELNQVYGVVYSELAKLYSENNGKHWQRSSGTMALIYEDPLFREIFYNLTADRTCEIVK